MDHTLRLLVFGLVTMLSVLSLDAREFTSSTGQKMQGDILAVAGDNVTLQRADGATFSVPVNRFSEADQKYIQDWQAQNKGKVPSHLKDKKPRLVIRVSTGKTSKDANQFSGFVDEHKQKVQMTVVLENKDAVYPIQDAKLTVLVLGTSPENGDDTVVHRQEFSKINLALSEPRTFEGNPFELWYDDQGAMYGHKYKGYIVMLEDPEGKVLAEATIPSGAMKYLANAKTLVTGDIYDREYKKKGKMSLEESVKGG